MLFIIDISGNCEVAEYDFIDLKQNCSLAANKLHSKRTVTLSSLWLGLAFLPSLRSLFWILLCFGVSYFFFIFQISTLNDSFLFEEELCQKSSGVGQKIEIQNFLIEHPYIMPSNSTQQTRESLGMDCSMQKSRLNLIIILEAHHHLWWMDTVSSRKGKTGYKICITSNDSLPVLDSALSLFRCSSLILKGASFKSTVVLWASAKFLGLIAVSVNSEVPSTCAISIATLASMGNRSFASPTDKKEQFFVMIMIISWLKQKLANRKPIYSNEFNVKLQVDKNFQGESNVEETISFLLMP